MIPQPVSKTAAFSMMLAKRYGMYFGFAFHYIIKKGFLKKEQGR
jgi:hypothetical protein